MTNSTTTGLTAATTPLAGTELVPIVQTGSKKVTVANLTAGRAVQALSVTTTGTIKSGTTGTAGVLEIARSSDGLSASSLTMSANDLILDNAAGDIIFKRGSVERIRATAAGSSTTGDSTTTGNFVPSTSGKGVDFSVVTPAAGMTSQILTAYEEGTWTPTIRGSVTAGTESGSKNATYTRVGNRVFARLSLSAFTLTGAAGNIQITGLPFSAKWNGVVAYAEGFTPAFTAAIGSGAAVTLSTTTSAATTTVGFRPSISATWDNYMTASSTWTGGGGSTYIHIELWGTI